MRAHQRSDLRAAKAAEVDDADHCATVAAVVSEQMQGRNQVDINEIQTAVENQLMSGPYKQLARAYIEYRHDRDIEREKRGRRTRRSVVWSSRRTPRYSTKTPTKTAR
ncbi:ATP cone domain-containing protein [Escherichia coli]